MRQFYKNLLYVLVFVLLLNTLSVKAQNYERISEYEQELYGEAVYVNGEYETMKNVRAYWVKECNKLKSRNHEFVLCGNTEAVLKVTIPSRVLFHQSEATLSNSAENVLKPLLKFVFGDAAIATCIVSCHSDNNGSDKYLTTLTESRASAVANWFIKQGVTPAIVSSYGLGKKVSKTKNENIRQREQNRRVTIYFVPNKNMLKLAKKGKL
ncbi:MAG: OmpA family protein [Bacteroidales bacterium]|nr:OmpA family protein [Bacteroidales bacterium]